MCLIRDPFIQAHAWMFGSIISFLFDHSLYGMADNCEERRGLLDDDQNSIQYGSGDARSDNKGAGGGGN